MEREIQAALITVGGGGALAAIVYFGRHWWERRKEVEDTAREESDAEDEQTREAIDGLLSAARHSLTALERPGMLGGARLEAEERLTIASANAHRAGPRMPTGLAPVRSGSSQIVSLRRPIEVTVRALNLC
jgi:hypothetical protein